jgi:hypothetical protein
VPHALLAYLNEPSHRDAAIAILASTGLLSSEIKEFGRLVPLVVTGRHCAVIVSDKIEWNWELLVFDREAQGLRPIANIPFHRQRGSMPQVIHVPGPGCDAVAVRHLAGTGTGVYLVEEAWYRLEQGGVFRLLSYPIQGHVCGWTLFQRFFSGQRLQTPVRLDPWTGLVVEFQARYETDGIRTRDPEIGEGLLLFSTAGQLILKWDAKWRTFVRSRDSTMSFDDVEGLFRDGTDQFVERHRDRLIGLVREGTDQHRRWIRRLLAECHKSGIAKSIAAELENTPSRKAKAFWEAYNRST